MSSEQDLRSFRQMLAGEVEDAVGVLERDLLELERDPTGAPARDLTDAVRAAHSIKGAAGIVGAGQLSTLCHHIEDVLDEIVVGRIVPGGDLITALLEALDAMRRASEYLAAGDAPPSEQLQAATERVRSIARRPAREGSTRGGAPDGDPPVPPTRTPTPTPPSPTAPATQASVRLSARKLDTLVAEAGELVGARGQVENLARELERLRSYVQSSYAGAEGIGSSELADLVAHVCRAGWSTARDVTRATTALQEGVLDVAMLPFQTACDGLHRVVRDVASAAGKEATLEVVGGDVELDRRVLATLRDPLTHLVRNAVDHGIEAPATREQEGKDRRGIIRLEAVTRGGFADVSVSDDGRGIDIEALREAAAATGLATAEGDDATSVDLIFAPSLSTAVTTTEYSGRGVGMDIVRRGAESLGGTVVVSSEQGAGTRVTITVPLTLSTMQVLLVSAGGQTMALATSSIDRVVEIAAADVLGVAGRPMVNLDDRHVPLVQLAATLDIGQTSSAPTGETIRAVLVGSGPDAVALEVDDVFDVREVLVKPLGPRLDELPGALGGTVLVDGAAVLVLHPVTVARQGRSRASASRSVQRTVTDPASVRRARVLLVEDTVTTRALERSVLESAGYDVEVAGDGAEAWRLLQEVDVDIVVSDIDMPRMDGAALCRAIRGAPQLRDLPIVLVTSLGSEEDRRRGLEAGADAYIVKSGFDQRRFIETIERLL